MTDTKATLSIQWHITSRCMKHCRHCYMFESDRYKAEIENELKYKDMLKILDDIADFEDKWNFDVKDFFITGGDPILNPDYIKLLQELKRRKKRIYIMGNPETLTPEVIETFKSCGVLQMQMSLDGLKETHDYYRGVGNFDLTVEALKMLDQHDMIGTIMFTLTGENKEELIPLMDFVSKNTKAKGFAFDLVCGVGNAKDIGIQLAKEDVKHYFELYLKKKSEIKRLGNQIRISEKSKFFQLIHYDNYDYYPFSTDDLSAIGGCYVGFTCYTILADGSVSACRRFPTIIGKMPEQKMEDIFLNNDLLKKFRRANEYESCGKCFFFKSCRGCPAVTYGYTNQPLKENPLCFKDLLKRPVPSCEYISPKMDTTMEEEAYIIKQMLHNQYSKDYSTFIKNEDVLVIIGTISNDKEERHKYFTNPKEYVKLNGYNVSDKEISYICHYIECVLQHKIPNPIRYALDM